MDTSQVTAKLIVVGKTKVKQIRKILSHPIKDEVLEGKVSINQAYNQIKAFSSVDPDEETYRFYKSDDSLGCAPYGWDPIVREEGGNLKFIPNRLFAPTKTRPKIGSKLPEGRVLVSPKVDLFDERVDSNWSEQILDMIKKAERRWTFLLITDYPERLVGVELPSKVWIGVRVNSQAKVRPAEEAFEKIEAEVKFLVSDPLLEKLSFENLKLFDWLLIGNGADLPGVQPFQPQWGNVVDLLSQAKEVGVPVWFSKSLRIRPMEFPRRFPDLS
jgi:protein gp37